ncbi:SHOCT domain-containing protein [Acidovorax sp.]|uniref:SHOCT domain-containing protein n=1 Tax=Acidovorax sp. TaxID=1872122 RepID=UPI003CFF0235
MVALRVGVLGLAVCLSACANRPASIKPSFVSHERFIALECPAIQQRLVSARSDLARYSVMQAQKANNDAVGVFLLGVPFSKMSGDHEADVARAKGEIEALETAQIKNRCDTFAAPRIQAAPAPSAPTASAVPTAGAPLAAPTSPVQTQLETLRRLHADGLITQQEYDTKRKKVLDGL